MEQLVESIVRAVLEELAKRGVEVDGGSNGAAPHAPRSDGKSTEIDFSDYKTPVLTERHVRSVDGHVTDIIVPAGTFCTSGAKDLIQKKKMNLKFKSPSH